MHRPANDKPHEPWYRQGWPWFLIAFPATAVVAGIATLVIAIQTFDGMVVDDYYKEGRAIVQTIGRVEHAREMGHSGSLWALATRITACTCSTLAGATAADGACARRSPVA